MFNFTSKDKVNSRTAKTLDSARGEVLTLIGYGELERTNFETGEIIKIGALKTEQGMYTTISKTAMETLSDIENYMADEGLEKVDIKVEGQVSKNDRTFLTISLV